MNFKEFPVTQKTYNSSIYRRTQLANRIFTGVLVAFVAVSAIGLIILGGME